MISKIWYVSETWGKISFSFFLISLIDISLKQENLPLIFDDGETTDYVIGQNHILTPQITIKKNKLSLLFNSTGKGNIQNEKIILRYPNCY